MPFKYLSKHPTLSALFILGIVICCIPIGIVAVTIYQNANNDDEEIYVIDVDGDNQHHLTRNRNNDWSAVWSPDGRQIAYLSNTGSNIMHYAQIYLVAPDRSHRRQLTTNSNRSITSFAWSPDGSQIVFEADDSLYLINVDGKNEHLLTKGSSPVWSPTGSQIAFLTVSNPPNFYQDIYLIEPDGSNLHQLTNNNRISFLAWSPDGSQIAFTTKKFDYIYLMAADGSNQHELTYGWSPAWSPDGSQLVLVSDSNLYLINVDGTNKRLLTKGSSPAWSPDGRKIAFVSDIDERGIRVGDNTYLINVDGTNKHLLAERRGSPAWSPDGKHILLQFIPAISYW